MARVRTEMALSNYSILSDEKYCELFIQSLILIQIFFSSSRDSYARAQRSVMLSDLFNAYLDRNRLYIINSEHLCLTYASVVQCSLDCKLSIDFVVPFCLTLFHIHICEN